MAPPPPRQPPELVPDIIGEILLLLPPSDPSSLVRASLVCKLWRRLLSDPSFHRRYCIFHSDGEPPPLLGFLSDRHIHGAVSTPRFFPTVSPSPIPQPPAIGYRDWSVIDCRHGRVLFDVCGYSINLVVWDPITGDYHVLPEPPIRSSLYGAAVLCTAVCGGSGSDHLDCHGGPFLVVLMALDNDTGSVMQAQMYSSETGAWNLSAHRDLRLHVARKPSTLIGDDIYFGLDSDTMTAILRYDLGKNCLSTIDAPQWYVYEGEGGFITLEMEDGSLGFAHISATWLHLWSRNADTDVDDGWELWRTFDLAGAWIANPCSQVCVVGSAEGTGVIFVSTYVGLFIVGLSSSGWIQKVSEPGHYDAVFPFMSFYTRLR